MKSGAPHSRGAGWSLLFDVQKLSGLHKLFNFSNEPVEFGFLRFGFWLDVGCFRSHCSLHWCGVHRDTALACRASLHLAHAAA